MMRLGRFSWVRKDGRWAESRDSRSVSRVSSIKANARMTTDGAAQAATNMQV